MPATPLARLTVCGPGVVLTVASPGGSAKLIGSPSKAGARSAADTGLPAESVSREAVMVALPFGPVTCAGLAAAASTSQGVVPSGPVSQPAVPGPVLQPHQFSAASGPPPVPPVTARGPVFPTIRL